MKTYKQSLLEGLQSVRVNNGYNDKIIKTKGKFITISEFPNHRFFVSNYYSPINGELREGEMAIYEYTSGWRVGNGKTLKAAKLDAVETINRNGGEDAITRAVSQKKVLNK